MSEKCNWTEACTSSAITEENGWLLCEDHYSEHEKWLEDLEKYQCEGSHKEL